MTDTERVKEVDGIVGIGGHERVDDLTLTITNSEDAIVEAELDGGEEIRFAFDRDQAEGFCEMVEESYAAHDAKMADETGDRDD